MTAAERLLERLEGVRATGDRRWEARCPAHDDRKASLGIGVGQKEQALLYCHAGCETADVLEALGLGFRDLYADNGKPWTTAGLRRTGATFERDGRVRLGSARYLPSAHDGERKTLVAHGSSRELWPDPAGVVGETLFVVEGEPDAVTGASLGLPTVAVPGAGKWRPDWASRLAQGRQCVVIIPDADEPGRKSARRSAEAIAEYCPDVRVLDLDPQREDGHDLSDWAAGAVDERECAQAGSLLVQMAMVAPRVDARQGQANQPCRRRVVLTPASSVTPERVRWLWCNRLPLRGLSLVAGEPGLGKSTLTAELAAQVTRGTLEGNLQGSPRDVLIATAEDHFASVVWGRLRAAGAAMDRVHRVHVEDRDGEELLTLPDDVAEVEARCAELAAAARPVALITIDPITAFIGGNVDTHRDAAVRRVLAPLAGLAEREQLAVLGVSHLNKDQAAKLLARVGGSVAFGAAPRSVLAFARHPDDPDGEQGVERVIVQAKSNHGRYAPALAARIEPRKIPEVGEVARLVIVGECEVGLEDVGRRGEKRGAHNCEAAILAVVADGPRPSQEVKVRVKAELGCSPATVKRAAKRMQERGELTVEEGGFPRTTTWALPVGSRPTEPTGRTGGEPIEQSSSPEPDPAVGTFSRLTPPDREPIGGNDRSAEAAEAELERLRAKFGGTA
jgi:putative DNA primase/helicase